MRARPGLGAALAAIALSWSPAADAQPEPAGLPEIVERRDTLTVGDKAPALQVQEWVRGEPVERFDPGRAYVVEFWATWCGPCIAGIPHLAEVQQRFEEHADVISVTRQDEINTIEAVREFVAARDDMRYRVAFDRVDFTWRAYMDAAGRGGIPCAFIIDKAGRIAWIGHPADPTFEHTLGAIVRDEFDLDSAVRRQAEARQAEQRISAAQAELHAAWDAGETDRAFALADEIIASDPEAMSPWAWWKFESLMVGVEDPQRAFAFVRSMMQTHYREDADMLMRFAYGLADSIDLTEVDQDLSLELAERAVALTLAQDYQKPLGLAMVRLARQEYSEAVAVLERAIDIAPDEQARAFLRNELDFYRWEQQRAEQRKGADKD